MARNKANCLGGAGVAFSTCQRRIILFGFWGICLLNDDLGWWRSGDLCVLMRDGTRARLISTAVRRRSLVSNLRPNLLPAPHRPLVCLRVSSPGYRETAASSPLRFLASPAITSSSAVSARAAGDLCIRSWRAGRVHWRGIECRQRLGPCAGTAACRWLRGHRLLRAGRGTKEG